MSRLLHRLGRSTAAHPWRTIFAWVLVAVGVYALAGSVGGTPQDNWDIPAARAQVGIDQLREHTPGAGNASARVVVHTRDGAPVGSSVIGPLTDRLEQMDHVVSVSAPRLSADRDTALLTVEYDAPVTDHDLYENLAPLDKAVAPTRDAGVQVELGGDLPDTAAAPMRGSGELIGIVAALLILVLAFGSVVERRPADRGRPHRARCRLRGDHPARRDHGREHCGSDGGHHGRPRRRHRLRPPAGHPVHRVPRRRAGQGRGGRTRSGDRRPFGRVRLRDGAGLAARPEAGRAADLRRLRLRHRDRRRRGRLRRADPGAGPVRPRRSTPAPAQGPQGADRDGHPVDGTLGDPRRPTPTGLGTARSSRDAHPGRSGPVDAHLAAGLLGPALRPDHPQGL